MNNKEPLPDLIESSQELSVSVVKFIKYCQHLALELEGGMSFSQEWYRWGWYAAIIQNILGTQDFQEGEKYRLENNIYILIALLQNAFFDDDFQSYTSTYTFIKKLCKYSDIDFNTELQLLAEKWMTLAEQIPKQITWPKIYRLTKEILQNIDISLYGIKSFLSFLDFLAKNPSDLYAGREKQIHPKYSIMQQNFYTLMEMYKSWEIKRFHETIRIGLREWDSISDVDIVSWYTNIQNMPLERQLLAFWIYLLKIWEFDVLEKKEEIYAMLLSFAEKVAPEYRNSITEYIDIQESADTYNQFDENLSMYIWEFMDYLYDGTKREQNDCISTLLDFLEEEWVDVPEDILEIDDIFGKVYSLFSFLLIWNYIADSEVKEETLRICLEYFQEKDPEHERELLEFFVEDNSDFPYESLWKKSEEEIMLLERKEVTKAQRVSNAYVKSMLEKESTEIAQHFENFYSFLKILDSKPQDLYIMFEWELSLHPKYEKYAQSIERLIFHFSQLQKKEMEQKWRLWKWEGHSKMIQYIDNFYTSLFWEEDLQKKAFILWSYLLRLWEFENFIPKEEVREILLGLSKRSANGMSDIVANHIFQDENDEFQWELNGYLLNILDIFEPKGENIEILTSHFEALIYFLEQTGIIIPDEISKEEDTMELFHQILINLLFRGIIGDRKYRQRVWYICLDYFENKDIDTEIKILDYLKNNT